MEHPKEGFTCVSTADKTYDRRQVYFKLTTFPSMDSAEAARTTSSVIKFNVPRSSWSPQSPQAEPFGSPCFKGSSSNRGLEIVDTEAVSLPAEYWRGLDWLNVSEIHPKDDSSFVRLMFVIADSHRADRMRDFIDRSRGKWESSN